MRLRWPLLGLILSSALALTEVEHHAQAQEKDSAKTYAVPFRLTDSGHILVRTKINGKGPYNFIIDTGAPMVYVSEPVAKKLGIKAGKKAPATLDAFQLEGGPVHEKLKCVVETPFQLEGMNAMGFAGVELHGIIGYNLLAQFKMEIDLTKDRMTWTKLDFTPPAPQSIGAKGKLPEQLDAMGKFMKAFAGLLGTKGATTPQLRGFMGFNLAENDKGVIVQSVLKQGPAAEAGVQTGDRIAAVQGKEVGTTSEASDILSRIKAGQEVQLTIHRGDDTHEISFAAGRGM